MSFRSTLVLAVVLATGGKSRAEDQLVQWVGSLDSEDYKTRERASSELIRLGHKQLDPVRELCLEHYLTTRDPEIRQRCKAILMELLKESFGFIGIKHEQQDIFDIDGRLRRGVEVRVVLAGKPAEKAGLRVGDVILTLDGQELDPAAAAEDFGRRIRLMGPGHQTALEVERAGERLEILLTTGAATEEVVDRDPEARFTEWLNAQAEESTAH